MVCGDRNERCYSIEYDSLADLRDQEIYCNSRHVARLDSGVVPLVQYLKTHKPNEQTENGR